MLNTRNEGNNTVFYSDLACCVNTVTLNMYVSRSYTGLIRRNASFLRVWLRHVLRKYVNMYSTRRMGVGTGAQRPRFRLGKRWTENSPSWLRQSSSLSRARGGDHNIYRGDEAVATRRARRWRGRTATERHRAPGSLDRREGSDVRGLTRHSTAAMSAMAAFRYRGDCCARAAGRTRGARQGAGGWIGAGGRGSERGAGCCVGPRARGHGATVELY